MWPGDILTREKKSPGLLGLLLWLTADGDVTSSIIDFEESGMSVPVDLFQPKPARGPNDAEYLDLFKTVGSKYAMHVTWRPVGNVSVVTPHPRRKGIGSAKD